MTVNELGNVVQRDGFYPFGLTFNSSASSPENLYKLTGNEEQKEWNVFDFNARIYDPALGRFNSIDPLAETQDSWNPYHYNYDNPVAFVDPTGLMPESNHTGLDMSNMSDDCGSGDAECQKSQSSSFDLGDDFVRISSNGGGNGAAKLNKKTNESRKGFSSIFNSSTDNSSNIATGLSMLGVASIEAKSIFSSSKSIYDVKNIARSYTWNLKGSIRSPGASAGWTNVRLTVPYLQSEYKLVASLRSISKPLSNILSYGKSIGNYGGVFFSVTSVGVDAVNYRNGDLSGARFSYRTGVTGVSLGVGYFVSGGWGVAVSVFGVLAEKAYDSATEIGNKIKYEHGRFVQGLKYWH